jgi:hypothetical protein
MPTTGDVDDLWLIVGVGDPKPVADLYDITRMIAQADSTTTILPLSAWVAALAAELTKQADTAKPTPQASQQPADRRRGRAVTTAALLRSTRRCTPPHCLPRRR